MGKGKQGEAHMKFFNDNIIVPYAKAVRSVNALKQASALNLQQLKKTNKSIAKDLKKVISKRTKAVIVVHLTGRTCDLEEINKISKLKLKHI